jgi:hypothetical protein
MDAPRLALRASGAVCAGLLLVLVAGVSLHGGDGLAQIVVQDSQGNPLPVPAAPTVERGLWKTRPVLVFVVPAKVLEGVDAARGAGSATPSIEVPGHAELRLFALSAMSTQLGCTVVFNAQLGASKDVADYDGDGVPDGRIMDPCSQYTWDAFHDGAFVSGKSVPRLASLDVQIVDGHLSATVFDGPIGPAR